MVQIVNASFSNMLDCSVACSRSFVIIYGVLTSFCPAVFVFSISFVVLILSYLKFGLFRFFCHQSTKLTVV